MSSPQNAAINSPMYVPHCHLPTLGGSPRRADEAVNKGDPGFDAPQVTVKADERYTAKVGHSRRARWPDLPGRRVERSAITRTGDHAMRTVECREAPVVPPGPLCIRQYASRAIRADPSPAAFSGCGRRCGGRRRRGWQPGAHRTRTPEEGAPMYSKQRTPSGVQAIGEPMAA